MLIFYGITMSFETKQHLPAVADLCACVPPNSCVDVLPQCLSVAAFGDGAFEEAHGCDCAHWGGPSSAVIGVPVRMGDGTQTQREDPVRPQGEGQPQKPGTKTGPMRPLDLQPLAL